MAIPHTLLAALLLRSQRRLSSGKSQRAAPRGLPKLPPAPDSSNQDNRRDMQMNTSRFTIAALCLAMGSGAAMAQQQSVEVLHWWTSGGEAGALNVLKGNLEKQGVKWNDMPVAGGSGEAAMTALRARVTSGNPPTASQMLGFDILDWGKQGVVADLNTLAQKGGWDKVVPPALQKFSKYNGKWIAAPVNIHSTNWVWANQAVLAKAGVTAEPKTWDEFIAAAEKVQKAGFVAIAHGGQPWQDATLFESVALSTGGIDYYRTKTDNARAHTHIAGWRHIVRATLICWSAAIIVSPRHVVCAPDGTAVGPVVASAPGVPHTPRHATPPSHPSPPHKYRGYTILINLKAPDNG